MKQNIKVAKELVKLAKNLIALDEEGDGSGFQLLHDYEKLKNMNDKIADKEGLYRNFSGVIKWGDADEAQVKNATFTLTAKQTSWGYVRHIDWYSGTWKNGDFIFGTWKNGTWEDGTFKYGTWKNGTWKNGYFIDSYWENGTWEDGTWGGTDGIWYDGVWKDGLWESGVWQDGVWQDGVWKGGYWGKGTWENGIWDKGVDRNRSKHSEGDSPDKWEKEN